MVSASDFTCYGVGFADHLENQIEIKRSFWSGSIINILFRKHTNYDTPRSYRINYNKMETTQFPLTRDGLNEIIGLNPSEVLELERAQFKAHYIGRDEYYFQQDLFSGSKNGWLVQIDRPFGLCVWNSCTSTYSVFRCKSE